MKGKKKNRQTLKEVEGENKAGSSSHGASKPSPVRNRVKPKQKQRSDTFNKSNETSEQNNIKEELVVVDNSLLTSYWSKFQNVIRRIVNNKYFRWFHL